MSETATVSQATSQALRAAAGLAVFLAVAGSPLLALTYSSGAPAGFAGNFDDDGVVRACNVCHFSAPPNSGTGRVTIAAPETFVPGEPLEITVAVVNTTAPAGEGGVRNGFSATVRAGDGPVGTLALGASPNVRFTQGSSAEVTHTTAGMAVSSWTFAWTPPAEGAPETVTVYAAGNAANGDGSLTGDFIYTTTRTIARAATAAEAEAPLAVALGAPAPNPVRDAARVALTLAHDGPARVVLADGRGRILRVLAEGPRRAGTHALALDASGLAAGTYFLVAETPAGRHARPVAIVR
ncbi:MAG: choice-of-anchor V domain-containing protein [Rubricoccaceae bacterium]